MALSKAAQLVPPVVFPSNNNIPKVAPKTISSSGLPEVKYTQPKGFWGKAMNVLNAGSAAVEKYGTKLVTGGKYDKYDTALDSAGIKNTVGKLDFNDVLSTTGRMVLDPLNVVPISKIAKGAGFVGKLLPGATKVLKGVDKGVDIFRSLPIVKKAASMFIKGYGVQDDVVKNLDNIFNTVGVKSEKIIKARTKLYKGMSDDEIKAVARFLEPQGAGKGTNLVKLRSQLGSRYDEVIKPAVNFETKINKGLVKDAYLRGNIDKVTAVELNRNPYLYHYQDKPKQGFVSKVKSWFTPDTKEVSSKAKAMLPKSKFKLSGEYWKKRSKSDFSLNTPLVQSKREIMQVKDDAIQDAITKITDKYGRKLVKGQKVPDGFKYLKVPSGSENLLEKFKGIIVPKNIAAYVEQSYHQSGIIGRGIDAVNRVWKPLATSYNPSFTGNNMLGNMYNSFLGGVTDLKGFAKMGSLKKINFSAADSALIKKSGLLSRTEFAVGDVAKRAFGKKNPGSFINKGVQTLNSTVENNARSVLFLDAFKKLTKKGLSKDEAMSKAMGTVDKFLFNYQSSLTPFEQNVMKRIFPFYTWARNNIPLQAESLITQTGKPLAALKLIKAANGNEMPEDFSIPTPFKNKMGTKLRYKPQLPLKDIANAFDPNNARDMSSPFLKMAISGFNYAAGGEAPVDYFTGKSMTNKNLPKSEQARDLISNYSKSLIKWERTRGKIADEPTLGNALRSIAGGFSPEQSLDSIYSSRMYSKTDKQKAIKSEITKSIKAGDIQRARRLEKLLGK